VTSADFIVFSPVDIQLPAFFTVKVFIKKLKKFLYWVCSEEVAPKSHLQIPL